MAFLIYKLTCMSSGKSYVGYTSRTLKWRWRIHVHYALQNAQKSQKVLLANAIRKHGISDWTHAVLETVETKSEALKAEIRLIAEHRTYFRDYPEIGYNMTPGGEWGPGLPKGGKLTLEHRKKIGDACRGIKHSLESVQLRAAKHRGMKRSQETKAKIKASRAHQICSEETRQKMSLTRRGRPRSLESIAKYKETKARKRFQRLSHQWFTFYPDVKCHQCHSTSWIEGGDPKKWGWTEVDGKWTCKQCVGIAK